MKKANQDKQQIRIYLDKELYNQLKNKSESEKRSLNDQICFILNYYFENEYSYY